MIQVKNIDKFVWQSDITNRVCKLAFGLQAGFFTNDFNKAIYAFENTEVGGVVCIIAVCEHCLLHCSDYHLFNQVINDVPSIRVDNMPYGGVKESGFGREGVRYAMVCHCVCVKIVLHQVVSPCSPLFLQEDMMELRVMVMRNAGVL
jgi:glyceraldehyde-3-phosphate dehydrogenase (NADP+)